MSVATARVDNERSDPPQSVCSRFLNAIQVGDFVEAWECLDAELQTSETGRYQGALELRDATSFADWFIASTRQDFAHWLDLYGRNRLGAATAPRVLGLDTERVIFMELTGDAVEIYDKPTVV